MSVKLYTYSMGSQGSKELARALGIKRISHQRSKVQGARDLTVINWGSSEIPEQILQNGTRVINPPTQVTVASNKMAAFQVMSNAGVPIVPFTTQAGQALAWLGEGHTVFARTIITGSGGDGIVVMLPDDPDTHGTRARLYTKYVKKKEEYRVHVCRGQVIDTQRKGLREEFRGHNDVNWMVRNLANGFIYARNNIEVPEGLHAAAIAAVGALGLDFGAVDIIWNQQQNRCYVLEINTAPGLVGSTIESYTAALRNII